MINILLQLGYYNTLLLLFCYLFLPSSISICSIYLNDLMVMPMLLQLLYHFNKQTPFSMHSNFLSLFLKSHCNKYDHKHTWPFAPTQKVKHTHTHTHTHTGRQFTTKKVFYFCLIHGKILIVCMRAQSLQSYLTLCYPMDGSLLGSSVHGILQGKTIGVDCHPLLQGIFLTQGWKLQCLLHLLHRGKILYC